MAQQPMYVNMHELANLAANRAQEMQIPAAAGRTTGGAISTSSSSGSNSSSKSSVTEKVMNRMNIVYFFF